jgi:hypothetical protein
MNEIIHLEDYRNKGNGAREALYECLYGAPVPDRHDSNWFAVDHILADLWAAGLKIIPLSPEDEK